MNSRNMYIPIHRNNGHKHYHINVESELKKLKKKNIQLCKKVNYLINENDNKSIQIKKINKKFKNLKKNMNKLIGKRINNKFDCLQQQLNQLNNMLSASNYDTYINALYINNMASNINKIEKNMIIDNCTNNNKKKLNPRAKVFDINDNKSDTITSDYNDTISSELLQNESEYTDDKLFDNNTKKLAKKIFKIKNIICKNNNFEQKKISCKNINKKNIVSNQLKIGNKIFLKNFNKDKQMNGLCGYIKKIGNNSKRYQIKLFDEYLWISNKLLWIKKENIFKYNKKHYTKYFPYGIIEHHNIDY